MKFQCKIKHTILKIYLVEINLHCLSYADIFLVKAANKKEAKQKIYDYCKNEFDYKKKDILIYSLEELYKNTENDVVEIH